MRLLICGLVATVVLMVTGCGADPGVDAVVGNQDEAALVSNHHTIEGYPSRISVSPGETVELMVHSPKPPFSLDVVRYGAEAKIVQHVESIEGGPQDFPRNAAQKGCGWRSSYSLAVPTDWTSGLYAAHVTDASGEYFIAFIVKDPVGHEKDIGVLMSTNTWAAYNNFGGDDGSGKGLIWPTSFYGDIPSDFASVERPNPAANPKPDEGHTTGEEKFILKWLEQNDFSYSVITDSDVHENPAILKSFRTLILNSHAEYWSKEMFDGLEAMLGAGKNLVYLGGNGVYWKVTIDHGQIEVRKDNGRHQHNGDQGGRWGDIGRPASAVLGIEYIDVSHVATNSCAPYEVLAPSHWVFEGLGLKEGDLVGQLGMDRPRGLDESCVNTGAASGWEMDIITSHSPKSLVRLAHGANPNKLQPGQPGWGGDMIMYQHPGGGTVFSVGSITFTGSLVMDEKLSKMMNNVLHHLSGGTP